MNPFEIDLATCACPTCPACHQPPGVVVSASQAMCGNDDCGVLMWDLSRADGGMDNPQIVDLPREWS